MAVMNKIHNEQTELFFKCVLELKTIDECYAFFEDICTVKELDSISRRVKAAQLLSQNMIYSDIAKETGASTATISRVKRSLDNGNDGYTLAFDRINKK